MIEFTRGDLEEIRDSAMKMMRNSEMTGNQRMWACLSLITDQLIEQMGPGNEFPCPTTSRVSLVLTKVSRQANSPDDLIGA